MPLLRREVVLPSRPYRRLALVFAAAGVLASLVTISTAAPRVARATRRAADLVSLSFAPRAAVADFRPHPCPDRTRRAKQAAGEDEMHRHLMEQLENVQAVGGDEDLGGRYGKMNVVDD